MVLHLPHAEGGFGVLYSYITLCGLAWCSLPDCHGLWLPKDDLQTRPHGHRPLLLLRDIHSKLLTSSSSTSCFVSSPAEVKLGDECELFALAVSARH
jgi:hypothetical protein